jgi:hypothetical protein
MFPAFQKEGNIGWLEGGKWYWYTQADDEIFYSKHLIASLYNSPHFTDLKFSITEFKHKIIKCKNK